MGFAKDHFSLKNRDFSDKKIVTMVRYIPLENVIKSDIFGICRSKKPMRRGYVVDRAGLHFDENFNVYFEVDQFVEYMVEKNKPLIVEHFYEMRRLKMRGVYGRLQGRI